MPREFADRYTVRTPIGEGAFSVTYRAVDTALQRDVAIKVLREQYASHEGFDSRFEREARSAARISHPNVIPVYDYGRQEHLPYIVMQYVDGPNLKEYVRDEGPLTVEEALSFARQILDGLAAIHDEGIVHRDVKPQNVLIDAGLKAKITDFGVAFVAVDPGLTETGMAVGTAAYMAPEQASGEQVGPGADLYAVGVILYELLTGRLPFPGDNPVQVMYRHVNEVPQAPRMLNRSVPIAVEAVVLKALAKEPENRFPDARTMREALLNPGSAMDSTAVSPAVAAPAPVPMPPPQPPTTGQWAATTSTQRTPVPPARRPKQQSNAWLTLMLVLLVAALIFTLVLLLSPERIPGVGGNSNPTATEEVAGGGVVEPTATNEEQEAVEPTATEEVVEPPVVEEPEPTATEEPPTATEEVPPTETPEPEPTATETPEPEPTQPPEDDDDDNGDDDDDSGASGQFNIPLNGNSIPGGWNSGTRINLSDGHFREAGAPAGGDEFPDSGALVNGVVDVEFNTLGAPSQYIGLVITAMTAPGSGETPIQIRMNGNPVWSGPMPVREGEWTPVLWKVGNIGWLHQGTNVLSIETLDSNATLLVSSATIYFD